MNKLDKKFEEIKQRKRIGLMTHVVVGYPTLVDTIRIVKIMAENGVDIVELQIPFSDPLADGLTIMRACEESLANGTKVKDSFAIVKKLSKEVSIPLLFMSYYNTIFKYGVEKFCKNAKDSGVSGLIIPDMPLDEEDEEHLFAACKKYDLKNIRLVSPVSTQERLRKNAKVANGFIYCTARQGTTGAREEFDLEIGLYLKKVRKVFSIPLAVGFGISNRKQIKMLEPYADIAVVGSALIDIINKSEKKDLEKNVSKFIRNLQVE